jgi:hypothetical protein
MLGAVFFAAQCAQSTPIDQGKPSPCDGIVISVERAKKAIACEREVELRKTFECAPCPACPDPPQDRSVEIASASFVTGLVFGLLLFFAR